MLSSYLRFVAAEWRTLLFGVACTFLSTPGQTFFIALFVASFAADFGLTAGEIGALYLGATLCAAGLLPLAGQWIDRIDLRLFVLCVAGLLWPAPALPPAPRKGRYPCSWPSCCCACPGRG